MTHLHSQNDSSPQPDKAFLASLELYSPKALVGVGAKAIPKGSLSGGICDGWALRPYVLPESLDESSALCARWRSSSLGMIRNS